MPMHVSFADMSMGSGEHRINKAWDEPPPRYGEVREDVKAFTHEHMFYEERGRRYALEGQIKYMQAQLQETSRQRIELERSHVLLDIELDKLRKENDELRHLNSELLRQAERTHVAIAGSSDAGSHI